MAVEVVLWPQVHDDFRALPSDALRWEALRYFVRLRNEPRLGLSLTDHPVWGNLSDCRKIFLDETHERNPRWRIVYRLLPSDSTPATAEIIIVGPRRDDAVYREVMARLERPFGIAYRETER